MIRVLIGALVLVVLSACKGEEHTASRVVAAEGAEKITIAARSLDDTSVKWGTRAVGWETKRGVVLSMTVDDRPTVVLQDLTDAEEVPSQAELDALVASVKTRRSPDGQHLLVSWNLGEDRAILYHLLPAGTPFELELPGAKIAVSPDMDLGKLPSSEDLALEALNLAAEKPEDCSIPGPEELLWEALQDGAPGTKLEKPLLALWPTCSRTWIPVVNISRNSTRVSPEWKKALAAKRDAIIAAGGPPRDLQQVTKLCLFTKDNSCIQAAADKLVPLWPAEERAHDVLLAHFDELPQAHRDKILQQIRVAQMRMLPDQRRRAFQVADKWADCETFRAFVKNHLGERQDRDDCPGWPLKRFPEGGVEAEQLGALVTAGNRNDAIKLVRKTTGWEDGKAVEFVDRQSGN